MVRQNQFDVFLAHNSADKPQVRIIANKLREQGLIPWLDEEEILAGRLFQDAIQRAISESKSAAIFIGLKGLGAWQELELQTLISQFVRKKSPVIPVLLPEVSEIPDNLLFLQQFNWVKFEHINNNSALSKLVQGIRGRDEDKAPPRLPNPFQPLNGRIEQSEQFFNREKELRDIFEILNAGSGVELLGDRQIGKSSILQQIKHRAASALTGKWEPVYLNLQKVHTETEFYESFCEELGIANCTGIDLNRAMRSRRVLLLLDETENLQGNGFTREIRDRLRAFAEDGSLRLVVAACTPLDRLFPDSHENGMTSPFQGICLRVELKSWQKETVQKFVAVKLENTGICFSEEEIEKLWLESRGYPQKLMKACFDLYRQYRQNL
jgi:TIR domain